jgi:chromosome partitioning protein
MIPVLAVANHKGGTGKTTTTHVLGAILARIYGLRTLMIDMDAQSSLTEACGIQDASGSSMADVLLGKKALDQIVVNVAEDLWLAPASLDMTHTQSQLYGELVGRETVLRGVLRKVQNVDLVLLDCPPSRDLLAVNALVASSHIITPARPVVVDMRGLRLFFETVDEITEKLNEELCFLGVVLTFWRGYNAHKRARMMLETEQVPLFAAVIGESVKVAEGPEFGKSIFDFDHSNPRVLEYEALALELVTRLDIRGAS